MQLFYAPNIETELQLPQEEAQHCFKVLRKQIGDEINIIDGRGNFIIANILDNNPKKNALEIVEKKSNFHKREKFLHIAIAPTKNLDRMEWLVEKVTEIGVDKITFLLCDHSERKILKTDRLYKKAISAMKQSVKAYLPELSELITYSDFIKNCSEQTKLIAHLKEDCLPIHSYSESNEICILIGPEGDFSEKEIQLANEKGFESVTLGESRLRTETAGMVSCVLLN